MGKGKPRSVEKGALAQSSVVSSSGLLDIQSGPVYYPTEDEFKDPLEFIDKIRPEAEPYGICKIVPPGSWNPPFALDLDSFTFPTKTQAIHQLQARPASCDPKTFELEYNRFLEEHCGKKSKKKIVFEGDDLDLCKLFNAVKRYGGYDKVVEEKKWGEVYRFVRPGGKISECAKHVLCQLYREHMCDYEKYYNLLNQQKAKNYKGGMHDERKNQLGSDFSSSKRRRKNLKGESVKSCKVEEEERDQICEQCVSGLHGEVMLLCDRCNKGFHIYCLSPPLKQVPIGNWYCLECLNSDKDTFGFVPGKQFALEAFRRMAERAKKKWFGSSPTSRVQLEKKFWEIVEGSAGPVEVMYGSDLDTSVYGSGFPRGNSHRPASIEVEKWEEYCASPWNLNNLPKLRGSMLRTVHYSIAGVMVPWLYVGMLFSSFCWHFEDHCFYSMNYLHWGEPKYWYSVPGNEAKAFEKVMRKSLPDLFEAQPDLLFQLVTMLNPSVLKENGVPVYNVLQEPGNFVITFPRSYHGGFNFGLNCAEAVNFAPADWLPHGGFGAELYKLYRKAAVLSHEELLCVVAKSDFDIKASPYLKKELHRIYDKEKSLRERLWRNGIVSSSRMAPRKHPEYVGTEEDPTCIICQQYLYLSAVVCRCRPSSFVCLEHWENLCECKPSRHRLLYRHSLAELKALQLMTDKHACCDTVQDRNLRRQLLSCDDSGALTKKAIKGGQVTFSQLAEEWILNACNIFKIPYSGKAYVKALKKAEQFLWAGSEMDPVRDVTRNLLEAKRWAEGVRDCLSKVEKWSAHPSCDTEKVKWEHVENLLSCDSVLCNEPALVKLKDYEKEARALSQEISSVLSKGSQISISDWEILSTRVCDFPISFKESKRLVQRLSSAKAWVENVRKCVSEKSPAAVEADILYQLRSEILELPLQPPEVEMLMGLLRQVELCQAQCEEMLKGSINLKNVEALLQEWDDFTINIPELKLLKQYRSDAISWISHWNEVVINIHEREDQENVVNVLSSIQRDGELLKIQVDELSLVEIELKKARCRVKALKSLGNKMSLDFIQQLMMEATVLQIEKERLFGDISGVLSAAMFWEERATCILASEAQILDYEVAIRTSEDICAILPSLDVVTDALLDAKSWLKMSEPFLVSNSSVSPASSSLLKVDDLKELVSQSKLLKISLRERSMLQTLLDNCIEWRDNACSTLHAAECFLNSEITDTGFSSGLFSKVKQQVTAMESVVKAGLSLGLDFCEILKLQDACSTLHWCFKALSFSYIVPRLEEVEILMEVALNLPATYASSSLCSSLIDGINWMKKAAKICVPSKHKKIKLSDVEEVLAHSQKIKVAFPVMVNQLFSAIKKHNSWLEQVHLFFQLKPDYRSWILLVELKELGSTDALNCPELDMVSSEVQKVEQWKQRCQDIAGTSVGDGKSLFHALGKMKDTLDSSLYIYSRLKGRRSSKLCMCCSSNFEDQEFLTCSMCNDRYHLQCKGPTLADTTNDLKLFLCHYCHFLDSGKISQNGGGPLLFGGKRAELNKLVELLSDTEDFSVWIEERSIINQLVKKALACKTFLTEVVDFALTYHDENLSIIVEKLSIAMKAIEVAGIFDHQGSCNFEVALARHSWRVRANKLLGGPQKPLIQQIQRHLKEGLAIRIPPEDHFWQKLADMKHICSQWTEKAKKVSMDSGALGLENVFELITEGENFPVQFEKELKLLRNRSMLYCICRKPYDQRDMIACDKCDEWYHFDCVNLSSPPKVYICPACKLQTEDLYLSPGMTLDGSTGSKCEEPQTPSPRRVVFRCKSKKTKPSAMGTLSVTSDGESNMLRQSTGIECLLWSNRKPFRRAARKRSQLDSLSQSFYIQK